MIRLIATLLACSGAAATRQVSFWYGPGSYGGQDIGNVLQVLDKNRNAVTNLFIYCGHSVGAAGLEVDDKLMALCVDNSLLARVAALGIQPEIVVDSGSSDVTHYRPFFANSTANINVLIEDARRLNATGVSFDLEPQVGSPSSTEQDAHLYAAFLGEAKAAFTSVGLRLTSAVAEWSAMLKDYATLSGSVDRLLDMETYNADSLEGWLQGDNYGGYYQQFLAGTGKAAGPGLGVWNATCGDHVCWTAREESGRPRMQRMEADGIEEIAMFRIVQQSGADKMPQEWWWPLLAEYLAGCKRELSV